MGFCTGQKQTKLWRNQSHKGLKANRYFMAFFSPNHQCCVRRWWQSFHNTFHDLRKWIRMQWKLFEMYIHSFASFAATSCVVAGYFSPIWNHTNGFIFVESRNAHGNRRRKNILQFSTVKTHTFPIETSWHQPSQAPQTIPAIPIKQQSSRTAGSDAVATRLPLASIAAQRDALASCFGFAPQKMKKKNYASWCRIFEVISTTLFR